MIRRRPKFSRPFNTLTRRGRRRYDRAEGKAFRYFGVHALDGDDDYRYRMTMLLPIGAVVVDQCGLRWVHISEKWWLSENAGECKGYQLRFPVLVVVPLWQRPLFVWSAWRMTVEVRR